ncbi:unnamed protein product [Staurois parvus]|uniref:Uncharacterized protein n=1 Tax=Staurois parvus TaxID=386267 RepID=A0ABN9DTZ9_9NEOB|nr:unnamed protein product [Staurois parvus]
MLLTLVVSGKDAPNIGGQWEGCSLHCWSVGRTTLILVMSGKDAPYIAGQWEECPLLRWSVGSILPIHWWSVLGKSSTLMVSSKNTPLMMVIHVTI